MMRHSRSSAVLRRRTRVRALRCASPMMSWHAHWGCLTELWDNRSMSMPERNCNPDQFFHATLHERAPGDVIDPAGPHTHDKNFRVSMSDQLYMTKHADEAQAHAGFISRSEEHTSEL